MSKGSKSDRGGGGRNRLFSGSNLTPFIKGDQNKEQDCADNDSGDDESESYEMNSISISDEEKTS